MDQLLNNLPDILQRLLYIIPAVLLSLAIHEFCHGYMSYKLGDPTAKMAGRLTLNPIKHMDPVGTIMMIISGISGFGFGWAKPVPVNPSYYRNQKKGMRLTALAGPLSNFAFAIVANILVLVYLFVVNTYFTGAIQTNEVLKNILEYFLKFLDALVYINIGLGCFNLLPVPPLDGWKIFGSLLPDKYYWGIMQYEDKIGMIFLLIVVVKSSVLTTILYPIFQSAYTIVEYTGEPIKWIITALSGFTFG